MFKSDKVLTPKYLNWHAKLTGLPSVLTDRIQFSLYKKYKKETEYEPWQLSEAHASEASLLINSKPENKVSYSIYLFLNNVKKKDLSLEARPDPELIIKFVLEHFIYLKF